MLRTGEHIIIVPHGYLSNFKTAADGADYDNVKAFYTLDSRACRASGGCGGGGRDGVKTAMHSHVYHNGMKTNYDSEKLHGENLPYSTRVASCLRVCASLYAAYAVHICTFYA